MNNIITIQTTSPAIIQTYSHHPCWMFHGASHQHENHRLRNSSTPAFVTAHTGVVHISLIIPLSYSKDILKNNRLSGDLTSPNFSVSQKKNFSCKPSDTLSTMQTQQPPTPPHPPPLTPRFKQKQAPVCNGLDGLGLTMHVCTFLRPLESVLLQRFGARPCHRA